VLAVADCRLVEEVLFYVVDAGAVVATLFGTLLFVQHPHTFLRLRWWQVKMGSLLLGAPLINFYTLQWLGRLRQSAGLRDPWAIGHLEFAAAMAIGLAVWLIVLGRLKPRLGKNWAKDYDAGGGNKEKRA
jgi:hypothetical protein